MSPTYPFTTSVIHLLPILLLPFTTANKITLYPHPHPHQPEASKITLLYNNPTTLTLLLSPIHPSENLLSLTHTLPPPSKISLISTNHTVKAVLTLRQIGTTTFSITAYTTNPFHTYKTFVNATAPGVTIGYPKAALPAPVPDVKLGTYEHWLTISQLAVPLLIHPPANVANLHVLISAIPQHAIAPNVCQLRVRNTPKNTRFFRNSLSITRGVIFPPHCGIALSTDPSWLILRLDPYRVGDYKFHVEFQFLGRNGSMVIGNTITFFYEPLVPPVVITSFHVTLDPSGAELLQVPVENVLAPPRKRPLSYHDTVLKLFQGRALVAVLKPLDVLPVGNTPRRILRFRTDPIKGSAGNLRFEVKTAGRIAVVDPRHNVSIAVSSGGMAVLDGCTRDVPDMRFVKVAIGVPYNRANFTEWKNGLLKRAIGGFFPGEEDHVVRLVDVADRLATYATLVSPKTRENDLDIAIRELHLAMRNGSFASSVRAWKDDITPREVVYMNMSLCAAFPHLLFSASAGGIRGEHFRFLPLCTSFPTVLAFLALIILARSGLTKNGETISRYWNKIFKDNTPRTPEHGKPRRKKPVINETNYAPICTYPCEAREKFARRYDLHDAITSENVRDSDLDSSVEAEREEGFGKLVAVAREFGQGFWGLGYVWRKLRGYEQQEAEISADTGSTSKSPTIYIERVSYDCDFQTAAYR